MEQDKINKLTKEAQEKFEKAKAEILAELERKLNEEETREETAKRVAEAIDKACENCKCDAQDEDPLTYVNYDAIHWDDDNIDYREVSILYEPDKDDEPQRVCVEYESDRENAQIQIVLLNALAELMVDSLKGNVTFDEARSMVHSGWAAILIALAGKKIKCSIKSFEKDFFGGI